MPPFQQDSRINVQDLKAQMVTRIGPERAHQYFNHFRGYISLRFNKTELDKLVLLTIGKDNIGLHNEIIKAILTNAVRSDTPPPPPLLMQDTSKPVKGVRRKPLLQCAISKDAASKYSVAGAVTAWSNGTICAQSPRKERGLSGYLTISKDEEKIGSTPLDSRNCVVDIHRPDIEFQDAAEQSHVNRSDGSMHLCKRPRVILPSVPGMAMNPARANVLLSSKLAVLERGEAQQQWESRIFKVPSGNLTSCSISSSSRPPFLHLAECSYTQLKDAEQDLCHSSDLPVAEVVQGHMEQIAELEGLDGVSERCVEILSLGVDAFLKRLIQSCIDLVKARSLSSQGPQLERQSNDPNVVSGVAQKDSKQDDGFQPTISMLDFQLAMDASPQQLGQNWPLQLERLQMYSLDD